MQGCPRITRHPLRLSAILPLHGWHLRTLNSIEPPGGQWACSVADIKTRHLPDAGWFQPLLPSFLYIHLTLASDLSWQLLLSFLYIKHIDFFSCSKSVPPQYAFIEPTSGLNLARLVHLAPSRASPPCHRHRRLDIRRRGKVPPWCQCAVSGEMHSPALGHSTQSETRLTRTCIDRSIPRLCVLLVRCKSFRRLDWGRPTRTNTG